ALAVSDGGHEAALAEAPRLGLACGNAGLGLKNGPVGCGHGAPITCPPVPPVSGSVSIGGYDGAAAFSRPRPLAQSGARGGAPDARPSASSRRPLREQRADAVGAMDALDGLAEEARDRHLLDLRARLRALRQQDRVADD